MADYDYLPASDGSGDAALMHITAARTVGATTITVDTVSGVPAKFIATSGALLPSGLLNPTGLTNFKGHTSGGALQIDAYEPGSTDVGHSIGQVVIIKPTTGWANRIASFIKNATNTGTPENHYVAVLSAASAAIAGAISAASAAISGALTVGGGLTVTGQSRVVAASVASGATITPTSQIYSVTALAVATTIAVPSFASADGLTGIIRIKDNGGAQGLTFAAGYSNVSGLSTPTTTVAGKLLTIGYMYNATTSKWEIQGLNQEA